ncbi:hypothetical protein DEO72_LG10g1874 [Vigna unguiculata]|uniref:Uncharacterized protein n=1 Tax=Vigna unguiculata TaxID=3917 RepID=A0A4D6N9Y1_VIGUN|nr:hypothetical protein DEO72_LG10g1874 [Vigna unguiculata]
MTTQLILNVLEVQSDEHIPIVYTSNVLEQIHNGSDPLHNNTFHSLSTREPEAEAIASPDTKATNSSSDMAAAAFSSAAKEIDSNSRLVVDANMVSKF